MWEIILKNQNIENKRVSRDRLGENILKESRGYGFLDNLNLG